MVFMRRLAHPCDGARRMAARQRTFAPPGASPFARNVRPTEHGVYLVQLGYSKAELAVEDTAFFTRAAHAECNAQGQLTHVNLRISDESEEPLHFDTLMQSDRNVFYCRILRHGWWVPCRWSAAHYHSLVDHMMLEADSGYLVTAEGRWPIAPYDARPLPQTQAV